ncbi:hypothetical protein L9F63_005318, partial [Diploptera punctata]
MRHDHHDTEEEGSSEGIIVAKVVSMIVLGLASSILGLLPWKLAQWFKWNRQEDGTLNRSGKSRLILSLLLCFGGGALLCTTFMHMLPEVREAIEELQEQGKIATTTFHLPELIMCCGFFTMYLIEEIVHIYLHWREGNRGITVQDKAIHRSFSLKKCPGQSDSVQNTAVEENDENSEVSAQGNYSSTVTITTVVGDDNPIKNDTNNIPKLEVFPHIGHSHVQVSNKDDDPVVASIRGLLIVLALSIHELFEGLAVGLQTTTGYVWYMLSAVSAHKLVIAFCVGIELVNSRTKLKLMVIYILTFALVSPIGIGAGLLISDESRESVEGGAPNAVLQGMATGTLLYVVFFEVLQKERASKESDIKQLLAIMVGFFVMFGILVGGKKLLY